MDLLHIDRSKGKVRVDVNRRQEKVQTGRELVTSGYADVRPFVVTALTVEHLMAALAGCGIHNALIEIDGPEVPILDGSAVPFVRGFMQRGVRRLTAPVMAFEVLQTVRVTEGDATATLAPSDTLRIDFKIDTLAALGCGRTLDEESALREVDDDSRVAPLANADGAGHPLRKARLACRLGRICLCLSAHDAPSSRFRCDWNALRQATGNS